MGRVRIQSIWKFFAITLLAAAIAACKRDAPEPLHASTSQFVESSTGCRIAFDDYLPSSANPPLIILLHAQGGDRSVWEYMGERAAREGYRAIAFDLRGHGESLCGGESFRSLDAEDWNRTDDDLRTLIRHAIESGADERNIFLVGAGLGANLSLRFGLKDSRIQATILISPGEEYLGVTLPTLDGARSMPMLVMAAEGDSYAAAAAESLHASAPGYAELQLRSGTAFGADLLEGAGDPVGLILQWLRDIVEEAEPPRP